METSNDVPRNEAHEPRFSGEFLWSQSGCNEDEEAVQLLQSFYQEAEDLLTKVDEPKEPHRSRYRARDVLVSLRSQLSSTTGDHLGSHFRSLSGAVLALIGSIDMEVEEFPQCEASISEALELLSGVPEKEMTILSTIKCQNQLGLLWCMRGDPARAKKHLDQAKEDYQEFVGQGRHRSQLALGIKELLAARKGSPVVGGYHLEKDLELANVHTWYYLAQVHQKLGDDAESARCCRFTLRKQMELKVYQPEEWATNAATLAIHFAEGGSSGNEGFRIAKAHLAAAIHVLERHRREMELNESGLSKETMDWEAFLSKEAFVFRSLGKYCLNMMREPAEDQNSVEETAGPSVPRSSEAVPVVEPQPSDEVEDEFPAIEISSDLLALPCKKASNFEEARSFFLEGRLFCNRAMEFLTLEDHCSDHVAIKQDISRMYQCLVQFEPDVGRKIQMHKKRVELLEPLTKQLNASIYTLVIRQLFFELGEIYYNMFDLKLLQERTRGGSPSNKAMAMALMSAANFNAFLDTLKSTTNPTGEQRISDLNCRPALVAHFYLGRLHTKMSDPEQVSQENLKNKIRSYCSYKTIVDYCDRHPDQQSLVSEELSISQELVQLMPLEIKKMKAKLDRVLANADT